MAEPTDTVSTLLVELGVEELPAGSVLPLAEHLGDALHQALTDAGLEPGDLQVYATQYLVSPETLMQLFNSDHLLLSSVLPEEVFFPSPLKRKVRDLVGHASTQRPQYQNLQHV